MALIKELVVAFKADTKKLTDGIRNVEKNMSTLQSTVSGLVGKIGLAFGSGAMINTMATLGNEIKNFSDLTGISAEETNHLGNVLAKFGGNTQSAMNSLKALQKEGYSLKDTRKTLIELSSQFSKMSKQNAILAGQKLGLDESTILLLQQGSEGVAQLLDSQEALGRITEKEIKASKTFNNILQDLRFMFQKLSMMVLKNVLPVIQAVHKFFLKIFEAVRDNDRIIKIVGILALGLGGVLAVLKLIAIANIKAWLPFYVIGAIIVAIALVIEDIWAYLQGADSVTGELVKKYPKIAEVIETIKNVVIAVWEWLKKTWEIVSPVAFEIVKSVISTIINLMSSLFDIVKAIFDFFLNPSFDNFFAILQKIKDFFLNLIPDKVLNFLSGGIDKIKGFFGFGSNEVANSNSSSNITNTNNSNNKNVAITQNISTSNPTQLASATMETMQDQLKNNIRANSQGGY